MGARIQAIQHPRYSHMVVAVDPARREKSGRAHRHTYYFTSLREAQKKLKEIGGVIDAVGVQGLTWTPEAKRDAFEARALLDAADFANLPLAEVVARWLRTQGAGPASRQLVTPLLDACLDAKSRREGLSQSARDNIEVRVGAWLDREIIVTLGDITRERCLALADREGVAASTRKNDMNAVSSFLTWLVQEAYLPSHPLQGMKRPHVDPARPAIYTASQVAKLLASASGYREGRHARALGLLFFAGLRPSEVPDATLDLGAPPTVKVQGGKMRGRANRIVRLSAGAAEWLATQPAPIIPPTIKARMALVERTGIQWIQDGARHTWISVRLTLSQDENGTAREAGTSPDILYRHYHALMTREQAKEMAALGLAETPENG